MNKGLGFTWDYGLEWPDGHPVCPWSLVGPLKEPLALYFLRLHKKQTEVDDLPNWVGEAVQIFDDEKDRAKLENPNG